MDDIIVLTDNDGGIATLTTNSSQSHYGVPVLRIEGAKDLPDNDYGPADIIVIAGERIITGAHIVCAWGIDKVRTAHEVATARLFLSQWPDGPQIPHNNPAALMGRKGGSSTSERKQSASRKNGLKGGRPLKTKGRGEQ